VPERFSPGVFLRPLVQCHLLPTLIQLVGPAEVAYQAQIRDLYDRFDLETPVIYPRYSATIVEPNVARLLDRHDLELTEFTGDVDALVRSVLHRSFPEHLEEKIQRVRRDVQEQLQELVMHLDPDDHGLLQTADKSLRKVDMEIGNLEKKVLQAHRKKNRQVERQLRRIALSLFPGGEPQERVYPLTWFISKYGPGIVDRLYEAIDCNCSVHHLLEFGDR
jgi:uncharacterized protein YllA (UPF0747 family)